MIVYGTIVTCGSYKPATRITKWLVCAVAPKVFQYLYQEKSYFQSFVI